MYFHVHGRDQAYTAQESRPVTSNAFPGTTKAHAPKFNPAVGVRIVTLERRLATKKETEKVYARNLIRRQERKVTISNIIVFEMFTNVNNNSHVFLGGAPAASHEF